VTEETWKTRVARWWPKV